MRICRAGVRNYRSLREIPRIPMGDMTVLVGRNDAGKSNILYALNMFFRNTALGNDDLSRGCSQ
jgi:predicted ATPase